MYLRSGFLIQQIDALLPVIPQLASSVIPTAWSTGAAGTLGTCNLKIAIFHTCQVSRLLAHLIVPTGPIDVSAPNY